MAVCMVLPAYSAYAFSAVGLLAPLAEWFAIKMHRRAERALAEPESQASPRSDVSRT